MPLGCDVLKYKEVYLEVNTEVKEALHPILQAEDLEGWNWVEKGSRLGCLFYLPANREWREKCEKIKKKVERLQEFGLEPGPVFYSVRDINSRSWEKLIREAEEPRQVLDGFWVIPPEYSKTKIPQGMVIKLRGGMAFGTGDHPSTRLALGFIQDWLRNYDKILDLGTGSGILAIASAKLGAKEVTGIDNDPEAVSLARQNVKLNKFEDRVEIKQGDLIKGLRGLYSGVIINILYPQIVSVLPDLDKITEKKAGLVLSGVLFKQLPQLREKIVSTPWEILDTRVEGDWTGLYLEKKG